MLKKAGVKKKVIKKKKSVTIPKVKKQIIAQKQVHIEKILIENFIALQKINTNLSIKFDKLTNQISSLLELFETSAKTLAEKDFDIQRETRDNKQIITKIDNLLEQNRTIARGVALTHEANSQYTQSYPPQRIMQNPSQNLKKYPVPSKSPQTTEFKPSKRS